MRLPDAGSGRRAGVVTACQNAGMGFDLVVRGATVVTPGHREAADIGIAGGRIAQLGGTMTGTEELAADGLLAIPGGVDAHTHLVHQGLAERVGFPVWVDDFWSGSRAAIAGGITTIGNMTYPVPDEEGTEETPVAAITREMAGAAGEAAVDWFLHPILLHPAALPEGEVGALAGAGHASIKMFLADPDLAADEPALLAAATAAQAAGSVTLLHCEDGAMLAQAGEQLIAAGRGAVANFPDARPVAAEVAAVDQAIGIARRTGARIYIVHLSSAAALDRCRRARVAGLPVYVETRPLYLHLTRERFGEPDAAKYVGAPPLREQSDREALWAGLAGGDVDTVCSDHAPWTLQAKLDPELNVVTARQGVADLETLMPMLYSEGVVTGRITLDQFVALTAANAARIFGLYPRKGAIAVGSDADIALWDPGHRRTIDGAHMQSRSGYSVYDGWRVQGWPRFVIRRGQVAFADGQITARPGDGEWLPRNRTAGMLPPRRRTPISARPHPGPGPRIGCGCRTGAERCPGSRACALAAAVVAGQRDRDDRNGSHQPQQQHCLLQAQALVRPAGMSRFGARTPDRSPRADMDLLTHRHLLAGCQLGEYGQPRDQCRVTAGQIVLNRVQGLLLPRAHHWSPHRFAVA
jgi:dihydropyrimidinase